MVSRKFVFVSISILLLNSVLIPFTSVVSVVKAQGKGPRSDVKIIFYVDQSEAYSALKNGSIDFLRFWLNSTQLQDAKEDPNLVVAGGIDLGMFEFDLNNNYTISDFPSVKSPMHETKFRQAIAYATDKDYIMNNIVLDLGVRIDQPGYPSVISWMNETFLGENYPYKYNLTKAAQLLDELGFVDNDQNGWRNYPVGWPGASGADFTAYPLQVYVRNDHAQRLEAGRHLVTQLESIGIKCNKTEAPMSVLRDIFMRMRNYHIYTGGWTGFGYYPPRWLIKLYHSDHWARKPLPDYFSNNYVTGMNQTNLPNYPELDDLLEEAYYATSIDESKASCKKVLGFFVEKCISIPLYTQKCYFAYRKEVHNVLALNASLSWGEFNVLNKYTLLNAYKDNGEPLYVGFDGTPPSLNILFSPYFSYGILEQIYDETIYFQPFDPSADQPWLATSWNATTWIDPETEENKTKITLQLRNDTFWIKPETGENLGQLTAFDHEFGLWYNYQSKGSLYGVPRVHHVRRVNNFTFEIYIDYLSVYSLQDFLYPILPMKVWTNFTQLTELKSSFYVEGVNATTPGYLNMPLQDVGAPVFVEQVKANDTELVNYADYQLERGQLKIISDLPDGTNINITYWARGNPQGTYPGDLTWRETLVSNGAFYVADVNLTVGGYVYLKANPNYFKKPSTFERDIAILNIEPEKTSLPYGETMDINVQVENQGNDTENFRLTLYANTTLIETQYVHSLLPDNIRSITFKWNTTNFPPANYTMKAVAEQVTDEIDTSDNTYVDGTAIIILPYRTSVYISPSYTRVTRGVSFSIDVNIANVNNLYGFDINMTYNTTLLNGLKATLGSFLKSGGKTFILANQTNDQEGYIRFAVSLYGEENGVSGNGTLFTAHFNSSLTETGTSHILLCKVALSDPNSQPLLNYKFNGTAVVVEIDTLNHKAVKSGTPYTVKTVSNSTIRNFWYNQSDSRISFNATGPSNYMGFCNLTIPKEVLSGTFAVLVNGEAVYYEKSENETHIMLYFGFHLSTVKIEILLTVEGDLDGDREVTILDILVVSTAFDSKPGDPNWNPIADVVKDGKIDLYDAVYVCRRHKNKWDS